MSFFILSEGWRNWGFNKLDSIVQSYNNIFINKEEVIWLFLKENWDLSAYEMFHFLSVWLYHC